MNIFVTGASGLVGEELCSELSQKKHCVTKLTRTKDAVNGESPNWNLDVQKDNKTLFADIFIHLAGENIAAKRWSKKQKQKIYDSRILGTQNLVKQIIASPNKPQVFICASAIGFYGDRGQELLNEESEPGTDFVSKVCKDWELATQPLVDCGIRVVNLRFGVILSKDGGALKKMLLPFKCGLGGPIGSGQQKFSWISIDDAIKAIIYILETPTISGPVNITSPNPVSNKIYTKMLAKQLKRPAFFPMPTVVCRILFGEMADELLLSSQSVMPKKLIQHGFAFNHLDIESALLKLLK
jgi:uncharacterized protein (TIGR01777 family)